jgi:hypothetical protein
VFGGLATGVKSQSTGYLAGELFTVHVSTPARQLEGVERELREERTCLAHCSVLRVRASGPRTSAPAGNVSVGARSWANLENSIASASIYESS